MDEMQLETRLRELSEQRAGQQAHLDRLMVQAQEIQAQATQTAGNINAFNGAIQEVEHWMAVLRAPAAPVTLVPSPGEEDGRGEVVVPVPILPEALQAGDEVDGETMEKISPTPDGTPDPE